MTSINFLPFFLFLLVLYYVLPPKMQWPLLLIASVAFYASSGPFGLIFVCFSVVTIWFCAWKIHHLRVKQREFVEENRVVMSREERKHYNLKEKSHQKRWLILGVFLNVILLVLIKVISTTKILDSFSIFFPKGDSFLVPLGISFYTFRILGYLIDVFWEKTKMERNPFRLMLFTIFFPQLPQGPISRHDLLAETLFEPHKFDVLRMFEAAQRIIFGYFKKLVIADRLVPVVKELSEKKEYSGIFSLMAMFIYAVQLYCDFTGGMDIAIGVAKAFGISLPENFDSPFRSRNIFIYWRRWHITMGTWFRDYVFFPLSVSKMMQKWNRFLKKTFGTGLSHRFPIYISTMITWFVTGIWHGIAWNFIVWGLINGVVILISQELQPLYDVFHRKYAWSNHKLYQLFQVVRTFLMMALIRSFDIYLNVPLTFQKIFGIFVHPQLQLFFNHMKQEIIFGLNLQEWGIVLISLCVIFFVSWAQREKKIQLPSAFWYCLAVLVLIFGVYGIGYDASQFIYGKF